MKTPTTKEERKLRDADFEQRMKPRMLWPSTEAGTAIRTPKGYRAKPKVEKRKVRLTEAQGAAHKGRDHDPARDSDAEPPPLGV